MQYAVTQVVRADFRAKPRSERVRRPKMHRDLTQTVIYAYPCQMRKLPNCMKINQAAAFAMVGWYLMTPPVLSGTTNVLDTGAPLRLVH